MGLGGKSRGCIEDNSFVPLGLLLEGMNLSLASTQRPSGTHTALPNPRPSDSCWPPMDPSSWRRQRTDRTRAVAAVDLPRRWNSGPAPCALRGSMARASAVTCRASSRCCGPASSGPVTGGQGRV